MKHKEESSKKYFESIINAGSNAPSDEPQAAKGVVEERSNKGLSPIETLFHKHLKKSLVSYEDYYKELKAYHDSSRLRLQSEYTNKMVANPAQKEVLAAECNAMMAEVDQGFQQASNLLLEGYESYLIQIAPSPDNLPVTISLVIASRGIRFNNVIFKANNTLGDIREELERRMKEKGDAITAWAPNCSLMLKRNTGGDDVILKEENKPLSHWRFPPGAQVHVVGDIQLASDQPPECFTLTFTRSPPPTSCDYYTCKDCKFNWICKSCAATCHKGHATAVYILGHQSTWACCYCMYSRSCSG